MCIEFIDIGSILPNSIKHYKRTSRDCSEYVESIILAFQYIHMFSVPTDPHELDDIAALKVNTAIPESWHMPKNMILLPMYIRFLIWIFYYIMNYMVLSKILAYIRSCTKWTNEVFTIRDWTKQNNYKYHRIYENK